MIVPVGGYVVIRFRADNPGWWFLHCHIEPHQLEGMSMVVREGTREIKVYLSKKHMQSSEERIATQFEKKM